MSEIAYYINGVGILFGMYRCKYRNIDKPNQTKDYSLLELQGLELELPFVFALTRITRFLCLICFPRLIHNFDFLRAFAQFRSLPGFLLNALDHIRIKPVSVPIEHFYIILLGNNPEKELPD